MTGERRGAWRRRAVERLEEPLPGVPRQPRTAAEGGGAAQGPPARADAPARPEAPAGVAAAAQADAPAQAAAPAIPIQVNALQALARQVFGFRLAMIALAAPAALLNANPGLGARLVGAAVVATFMGSYVLFRDWERFGPLLLRHPTLLAADTLFGSLLLISAGPDTTLAYVSVCTPSSPASSTAGEAPRSSRAFSP